MVSIEKIKNPHNINTNFTKLVSLTLIMMGLYWVLAILMLCLCSMSNIHEIYGGNRMPMIFPLKNNPCPMCVVMDTSGFMSSWIMLMQYLWWIYVTYYISMKTNKDIHNTYDIHIIFRKTCIWCQNFHIGILMILIPFNFMQYYLCSSCIT
jgi:hypothetical protein